MPFDKNHRFYRLFRWEEDRDNGIEIRADRMDQEMDGWVRGINQILSGDVPFRNVIAVPTGSPQSPSFTFTGQLGTGFYCKDQASIGIAIAGQEVGTISAEFFEKIRATIALQEAQRQETKPPLQYASFAEAIAGIDEKKVMTPACVRAAIEDFLMQKGGMGFYELHVQDGRLSLCPIEEAENRVVFAENLLLAPRNCEGNLNKDGHLILEFQGV